VSLVSCGCVCVFTAACPCVSLCLAIYFVSFALLFDFFVVVSDFVCVQRVFCLCYLWTSRCFVFWSCMWFPWHMLCVFSFFVDIFCILSAIYMFACVCFGVCVTVRRCLLVFCVCCVCPVFFLLLCICKGSVAVFSFVCTYISLHMTVI
jgi:hypothetical protein